MTLSRPRCPELTEGSVSPGWCIEVGAHFQSESENSWKLSPFVGQKEQNLGWGSSNPPSHFYKEPAFGTGACPELIEGTNHALRVYASSLGLQSGSVQKCLYFFSEYHKLTIGQDKGKILLVNRSRLSIISATCTEFIEMSDPFSEWE